MLLDARTIDDGRILHADLCIVGAGAAGITLARELTSDNRRIILLESGGITLEAATQDLYPGSSSA
jgi:choline dehydrogenase-like flavoprotein